MDHGEGMIYLAAGLAGRLRQYLKAKSLYIRQCITGSTGFFRGVGFGN